MSLIPVDPYYGVQEPGFNHAAANVMFERIMKMAPDEAQMYAVLVLSGALQDELVRHGSVITKALDEHYAQRAATIRTRLARSAVSKARAGQDNTAEIRALEEVAKAFGKDRYTRNTKGQFWHTEMRHLLAGATPVRQVSIDYTDAHTRPWPDKIARRHGVPTTGLSGKDAARYQYAYAQIADMVAQFTGMNPGDAALHVRVKAKDGTKRTEVVDLPQRGEDLGLGLKAGERITSASLTVLPGVSPAAAGYDALAALGQPGMGGVLANAVNHGAGSPERVKAFGHEWSRPDADDNDAYRPSTRVFGRLAAGSALLSDTLGDSAPRKVQLALAVGQHVGEYGPEAQKVIGPHADKAAYRYRGTERAPDTRLIRGLESLRLSPQHGTAQAKREYLIHGSLDPEGNWQPSPTLKYFRSLLPNADLNTLQRKSGTIPPSQGIILNRAGQVTTQSVGYGDDHYLPFNLARLKSLRGGEYVRTRSFGGPTTEDIYTGLVSGARALTVVSHNGVYTVEFDDSLRGTRRYNDKAAQMVARYGQLLDAVKNGEITTGGLHPARRQELEARAARIADPDRDYERYDTELQRLLKAERRNPQLSRQQLGEATEEFFAQQAEKTDPGKGPVLTTEEYVHQALGRQALRELQGTDYFAKMPADAKRLLVGQKTEKALDQLRHEDPVKAGEQLADALGVRAKLDAHLARATKDYQATLKPLELNGPGYDLALQALQEQFPYYINRVSFQPWVDGQDRRDTGYVKPRHNRPEKALAGYFDPTITGRSKVTADSTRFQNHTVRQGRLHPYAPRDAKPAAGATTAGGGAVAAVAAEKTTDGRYTPEALKRMRVDADMSFLTELRSQTAFGQAVDGGTGPNAFKDLHQLRGETITQAHIEGLGRGVAPAVARLLSPSEDEAFGRLNDDADKVHRDIKEAAAEIRRYTLFDGMDKHIKAVENDGRPSEGAAFGNTRLMLRNPNGEYNLKDLHPAYDATEEPTASQVAEAYGEDHSIALAAERGHLPSRVDDPDFEAKAKTFHALLADADAKYAAYDRGGRYPVGLGLDRAEIDPAVEGLVKANQLRRRYKEAVGRETELLARATPIAQESASHTSVSVLDYDALAEALATKHGTLRMIDDGSGNAT